VIAYIDTSVLLKLFVVDEPGADAVERLWLGADRVTCAEIGYAEARAALAAMRRARRLDARALRSARDELDSLWEQLDVVVIDTALVRAAGDLAEAEGLRGYDAVHLAAAIVVGATILASADTDLVAAATRRGFNVANPIIDP